MDFQQLFSADNVFFVTKVVLLIFIGFSAAFAFLLFTQAQSLKRFVLIKAGNGSVFIVILTLLYFLASISLFLIALAIL